jgi:hypothetical protein
MDLIPFMEKLAKTDDIYSVLRQGNMNTFDGALEAASSNTLFIQQTKQVYSEQNQTGQSYLLNQSYDKRDFINKNDDYNNNNNSDGYSIHETSIVVSMDVTSSSFQKPINETVANK